MTKARTFIYAAIAIAAGGYCTVTGFDARGKQALLDKEGVEVPGSAEAGESHSGRRGRKSYKVDVAWTPEGGAPVTQKFSVSNTFFESLTDGQTIIKPEVKIRYAPTNPVGTAIVVGGSSHNTEMLPIGLGILAVGAGLVVFGVKKSA